MHWNEYLWNKEIWDNIKKKNVKYCSFNQPNLIIFQKKTIHKEELVKSEKEKNVRKQIVSNAPKVQQKKTQELVAKKSPQKVSDPKQQNVKVSIFIFNSCCLALSYKVPF